MRRGLWAPAFGLAFVAALTARALAYPHLAVAQATDPPLDPKAPSSTWSQATNLALPWNPVKSKPASEPTAADLTTDGHALYVRFDATQHEPIAAEQHTNDVGQGNDDEVWIDLWPNGISGYFYQLHSRVQRERAHSGYA